MNVKQKICALSGHILDINCSSLLATLKFTAFPDNLIPETMALHLQPFTLLH